MVYNYFVAVVHQQYFLKPLFALFDIAFVVPSFSDFPGGHDLSGCLLEDQIPFASFAHKRKQASRV
jgi:hypothetical protein